MSTDPGDAPSLADWLAARSDDELSELLRLRPDLSVPPPATFDILAVRAEQRASVLRAVEDLDTPTLTVLELLLFEQGDTAAVPRKRLDALVAKQATKKAVDAALVTLRSLALVRGTTELRTVSAARDALPWRVGRFVTADRGLTEDSVAAALEQIDDRRRELLTTLSRSSNLGRTRDAAPGTPPDRPVQQLLAAGLLGRVDHETVELPQQVSQVLRGEPVSDPTRLTPPPAEREIQNPRDVDAAAAGEALELLRLCENVLSALGSTPAPALKAGGLGVRELRRVAKTCDLDETQAAFLVELLAAAGLLASGAPDPSPPSDTDDHWAPTSAADAWLASPPAVRWAALAGAWLDLPRLPWSVGMRDANDKPIAALSDEARSVAAPRDRRVVLGVLADLDAGVTIGRDDVVRIATWRRPRLAGRLTRHAVSRYLDEAATLGILGRGAVSTPGRALLADTDRDAAAAAMASALPDPIDHVLVQADLTVVAPGPLTPELAHTMATVADIESAGAATMYRVDESTLRRALDAGMSAAQLHGFFGARSRTPVPQALTYLIDDVARRHGRLRVGIASSFVRCEDPALLAEVLASPAADALALRALAPTVAVSQAPLGDVLEALRSGGFAPAGEDSSGTIVDLRPRGARVPVRRNRSAYRTPVVPTADQRGRLVAEMRAGTKAATARRTEGVRADGTRASGAATISLLQRAAIARAAVTIGYVDAAGVSSQRVVAPVSVGGGRLDAWDEDAGTMRQFTLHRITSVDLVDR